MRQVATAGAPWAHHGAKARTLKTVRPNQGRPTEAPRHLESDADDPVLAVRFRDRRAGRIGNRSPIRLRRPSVLRRGRSVIAGCSWSYGAFTQGKALE
jgi:hypothetical protein